MACFKQISLSLWIIKIIYIHIGENKIIGQVWEVKVGLFNNPTFGLHPFPRWNKVAKYHDNPIDGSKSSISCENMLYKFYHDFFKMKYLVVWMKYLGTSIILTFDIHDLHDQKMRSNGQRKDDPCWLKWNASRLLITCASHLKMPASLSLSLSLQIYIYIFFSNCMAVDFLKSK